MKIHVNRCQSVAEQVKPKLLYEGGRSMELSPCLSHRIDRNVPGFDLSDKVR